MAACCSFSEVPGANPSTLSCVVAGLMSTHGVLLGGHRSFLLPFVFGLGWVSGPHRIREKLPSSGSPHDAREPHQQEEGKSYSWGQICHNLIWRNDLLDFLELCLVFSN